ncbi:uncharacterized protein LOC124873483 isoform X2 [Girardinichthys multiradiatus]|uniref:uncharacterized protein LOC124873483 isoform X2 n=1 Tax=Girardinichthys multiradiatus TaxID=208333 RepID=UPI001FADA39A|nr:uncharacterized protein LOC124873483 isoform X2 [Girardinichthys multiradiatus]
MQDLQSPGRPPASVATSRTQLLFRSLKKITSGGMNRCRVRVTCEAGLNTTSDMFFQLFLQTCVAAMVFSLVPVTADTQRLLDRTNLTCFKSSDPAAVDATQLHGDHNDKGDLWRKDPATSAPLPPCSSSSFSPTPSQCAVCLLGEVYILCDNLPAGAALYLERPGSPFSTKRSGCPILRTAGESLSAEIMAGRQKSCLADTLPDEPKLPPGDANRRYRFAAIPTLIFGVVIVTGMVLRRCCESQKDGSTGTTESSDDLETVSVNLPGIDNGQPNGV